MHLAGCECWTGRRFHLGDNKEVFDAEVFAIYQALRIFEARQQSGEEYTVFSDRQPAIRRAMSDSLGEGQYWVRAIIEVATQLVANSKRGLGPVGPSSCRHQGKQGRGWHGQRGSRGPRTRCP